MRPNGRVKVRSRKRKVRGKVYRDFVVDLGTVLQPDGTKRRRTRSFPNEADALAFLAEKQGLRRLHGDAALALSPAVALRYAAVEARLGAAGASIEQAADFWIEQHRPVKEIVTLGALLDRCVLDMELRKVANNTIATFACACGSFVESRKSREPQTITKAEIREWIFGNNWQPKTQRGYLGALAQLFAWGVEEELLSVSPLQPDMRSGRRKSVIKLPKLVRKEPEIFVLDQLRRLFGTAETKCELGVDPETGKRGQTRVYRRLIGYLALGTFGGIRPFELKRLEVTAIDIEGKTATLDGRVTKTSDRRVVELSDNCIAWLKVWMAEFPDYKFVAPPSWDRLLKGLRKAAGLVPWPHDVLRHCFASYFHATHGDKKRLQNQLGHSEKEDTLDNFYRAVRGPDGLPVTKVIAAFFWLIGPAGWKPPEQKTKAKKPAPAKAA